MPEEFQVINDHNDHVKILPNKRAPVTVEKKNSRGIYYDLNTAVLQL